MSKAKPKKLKPKRRRARGTGTIYEAVRRGQKVWIGRKVIGQTAAGKTQYKEVWGKSQGEVILRLAEAGPAAKDCTVAAWVARWVETLQVRPRTEANYRDDFDRHILPAIGHLQVAAVTPSQIESLATALGKKGLGVNSVRKALTHARIAFSAAVRDGIMDRNPVSLARKPKAQAKEIDAFTPAELLQIIDVAGKKLQTYPIALLAGTGCRVGEAIALDVGDFDPAASTIAISKTYHKVYGSGPPKSKRSVRTIRVPAAVVPILEAAIDGRKTGPMFLTAPQPQHAAGRKAARGRRSHELIHFAWKGLVASLGLNYRNPHQMRHSVATALISANVPLGDVAAYLGDSVETVVKTYLHPAGTDPSKMLDTLFKVA